jgi:hypothetical protein
VARENAKPGTTAWNLSTTHQADIEGYADEVSAQAGDTVQLYVSTGAGRFHVEAYRMGYYGGLGGRLVWSSPDVPGYRQAKAVITPVTNMVRAPWQPSLSVHIDMTWVPGDYLIKLVGSPGDQESWVPLTIRDDASHAALLIQNSVTTWQAYNLWGGYDLYEGPGPHGRGNSFATRSRVVSFDRPYQLGAGSADFLGNELPLVELVESMGMDISYWTDVDLHRTPGLVLNHHALISLGHDEYWSTAMRQGAEAARDHGVNIAFLGANAVFRRIRLEPSPLGAYRDEVDYKNGFEDPLYGKENAEVTVDWREPPVTNPENRLVGDYYQCNPVKADMVVSDASAWVFAGTGVYNGERFDNLVGSEFDEYVPGPGVPKAAVLAHSPVTCRGKPYFSDLTYYVAPSGAGVIATGTNLWVDRLSPTCFMKPCGGPPIRITANILRAFAAGPAGPAPRLNGVT